MRSQYVHTLRDLPSLLDTDLRFAEIIQTEHTALLTLEGLARVARAVIMDFVQEQPKVEKEAYDYSLERHGIVQGLLAPQYWIDKPELLTERLGRQWLEGLLSQISDLILSRKQISDLSRIYGKIEALISAAKRDQRLPLLATYIIFNAFAPVEKKSVRFDEIKNSYGKELEIPTIEGILTFSALGLTPEWNLDEHKSILYRYFDRRNRKNGVRAPALFEAISILILAERYRDQGASDDAKELLTFAADNVLSFTALSTLEREFDPGIRIDWQTLVPKPDADGSAG